MKVILILAIAIWPAAAQDEMSRQIWDDYFAAARPAPPAPKPVAKAAKPGPRYRPAAASKPATRPQPSHNSAALGVTVWKLDRSAAPDGARLLVQEDGASVALTPHRVEAGEPLQAGDKVRLSIESPTSGYLYVVDQEMHADGKLGAPYLIFPTTRTRGGDNAVRAGQLVEVPAQSDRINVFTIRPRANGEVGEKLTVILAPQPIAAVTIADREQEIPSTQFESWVRDWGAGAQRFDLAGGQGKPWTPAEKSAGADQSRLLTPDDPAPETVFLFPGRAGKPVSVSVTFSLRR